MNDKFNFNDAQAWLMAFAKQRGLTEQQVQEKWDLDYKHLPQENLEREMREFLAGMALFQNAFEQKDFTTAVCGLLHASIRANGLSDFFAALHTDTRHALTGFEWPAIPDDYEIPEHYGYRGIK
jgi:hypothetical protein